MLTLGGRVRRTYGTLVLVAVVLASTLFLTLGVASADTNVRGPYSGWRGTAYPGDYWLWSGTVNPGETAYGIINGHHEGSGTPNATTGWVCDGHAYARDAITTNVFFMTAPNSPSMTLAPDGSFSRFCTLTLNVAGPGHVVVDASEVKIVWNSLNQISVPSIRPSFPAITSFGPTGSPCASGLAPSSSPSGSPGAIPSSCASPSAPPTHDFSSSCAFPVDGYDSRTGCNTSGALIVYPGDVYSYSFTVTVTAGSMAHAYAWFCLYHGEASGSAPPECSTDINHGPYPNTGGNGGLAIADGATLTFSGTRDTAAAPLPDWWDDAPSFDLKVHIVGDCGGGCAFAGSATVDMDLVSPGPTNPLAGDSCSGASFAPTPMPSASPCPSGGPSPSPSVPSDCFTYDPITGEIHHYTCPGVGNGGGTSGGGTGGGTVIPNGPIDPGVPPYSCDLFSIENCAVVSPGLCSGVEGVFGAAAIGPLTGKCKDGIIPYLKGAQCQLPDLTDPVNIPGDALRFLACLIQNVITAVTNAATFLINALIDLIIPSPGWLQPLADVADVASARAPFTWIAAAASTIQDFLDAPSTGSTLPASVTLLHKTIPIGAPIVQMSSQLTIIRAPLAGLLYLAFAYGVLSTALGFFGWKRVHDDPGLAQFEGWD